MVVVGGGPQKQSDGISGRWAILPFQLFLDRMKSPEYKGAKAMPVEALYQKKRRYIPSQPSWPEAVGAVGPGAAPAVWRGILNTVTHPAGSADRQTMRHLVRLMRMFCLHQNKTNTICINVLMANG